jgi:hypothetical protein
MKTSAAAFALVLALGLSGCADNHASVELFGICAPPDNAEECGMGGTCDAFLASARPWVFLKNSSGSPNGLELFVEVHNQMPENADATAGRVNTNDAIITGYELDVSTLGYAVEDYFYPANFPVAAEGTFTPVIKFIPEEIGILMSSGIAAVAGADPGPFTAIVGARLVGHLLDGEEFTTGTFTIAVDVWNANHPGYACAAGQLVAVCPNEAQTASFACVDPAAP